MTKSDKISRDEIKDEVIRMFKSISPDKNITEETNLQLDLNMGVVFKRSLALPLTGISKGHGGDAVRPEEAESLSLVKDTINIVYKKIP